MSSAPPSAEDLGRLLSAISSKSSYHAQAISGLAIDDISTYCVSSYSTTDGELRYRWILQLPLAASLAGDLLLLPNARITESVQVGKLENTLLEAYSEVSNMLGTALNGPGKDRVVLSGVAGGFAAQGACPEVLASYEVRCGVGGPWRVNLQAPTRSAEPQNT